MSEMSMMREPPTTLWFEGPRRRGSLQGWVGVEMNGQARSVRFKDYATCFSSFMFRQDYSERDDAPVISQVYAAMHDYFKLQAGVPFE